MTESAEKEPTMEEILSSIRRIISEEDEESSPEEAQADDSAPEDEGEDEVVEAEAEAEAAPEPAEEIDADVLDLTDPLDPEPAFTPEDSDDGDDILVLDEEEEQPAAAALAQPQDEEIKHAGIADPEPEPDVEAAEIGDADAVDDAPGADAMDWSQEDSMSDRLVGNDAATAAAGAFARLARQTRVPEAADDKTLEAIVRELLKPMLKEWLDANLPSIVEKKVQEEVERLARQG